MFMFICQQVLKIDDLLSSYCAAFLYDDELTTYCKTV